MSRFAQSIIIKSSPRHVSVPAQLNTSRRIMRLYEEFGLSVSDDTVYRALKELGFSHVSARPRAYKQSTDANHWCATVFKSTCAAAVMTSSAPEQSHWKASLVRR